MNLILFYLILFKKDVILVKFYILLMEIFQKDSFYSGIKKFLLKKFLWMDIVIEDWYWKILLLWFNQSSNWYIFQKKHIPTWNKSNLYHCLQKKDLFLELTQILLVKGIADWW